MNPTEVAQAMAAGTIFREAIDRPEDERARLLDLRCAGDPGLRRRVEAMLADEAGGPNTTTPELLAPGGLGRLRDAAAEAIDRLSTAGDEPPVRLAPGVMVGRYRIERRLAEGGSSVVFEAVQHSTGLRVALKVRRIGFESRSARERFLDESRILARLHHPAIAKVHDAGIGRAGDRGEASEGDLPWIAVELVPGAAPILAACDARGLDRTQRLRLFETVCDAVHHAHQRGVIHRDLKPANILVGDDGRPKIIDFGIGRVTEASSLRTITTDHGALRGTIAYMSPERCAGTGDGVDVRSDVYSLGVVLFELVCGGPPRELGEHAPLDALLRAAALPVRRPSEVDRTVTGDLEQILLHALERDPADRYQSVEAFRRDIARLLGDQPIEARPPGWMRRMTLFARRHRAAAALLALAGLPLSAYLVTVPLLLHRARTSAANAARMQGEVDDAYRRIVRIIKPDGNPLSDGLIVAPIFGENRAHSGGAMIVSLPNHGAEFGMLLLDRDGRMLKASSFRLDVPAWLSDAGTRDFALLMARIGDFDPNHPGDEVLAVLGFADEHQPPATKPIGLVRLYDLDLSIMRDTWTIGVPTAAVWSAGSGKLVLRIDAPGVTQILPDMAPYDAKFCDGGRGHDQFVVGLSIEELGASILSPAAVEGASSVDFILMRAPDEFVGSARDWTYYGLNVADPPSGQPSAIAGISLQSAWLRQGNGKPPRTLLTAPIDGRGELLAPFSPVAGAMPAVPPRLVRLDPSVVAYVLSQPRAPFEEIIARLRGVDDPRELEDAVLADASLSARHPAAAVGMAKTMASNWRSLHQVAAKIMADRIDTRRPDAMQHALRLAEAAADLHDQRCVAPDRCLAAWYCYSVLAEALFRNERFEAALGWFERTERIWLVSHGSGEVSGLDIAWQSCCLARLGRLDDAVARLERAAAGATFGDQRSRDELAGVIRMAEKCIAELRGDGGA